MKANIHRRIDKLEQQHSPKMSYFSVVVDKDTTGIIPDEFDPQKDFLSLTIYEDRNGNPSIEDVKLEWRGKPYERGAIK